MTGEMAQMPHLVLVHLPGLDLAKLHTSLRVIAKRSSFVTCEDRRREVWLSLVGGTLEEPKGPR